jgi:membrane-associated PAP2 superfamily phosphatase
MRRRPWIPELAVLALLGAAAVLLFRVSDLDLAVSRLFYRPDAPGGPWPEGQRLLVRVIEHGTPWIAALLMAAGLAGLVVGAVRPRRRVLAIDGLLVVLVLAIGPGLLVNLAGKDHWRRPRPHRTVGLGGDHQYVPPLAVGPHGRSFPSGHASVGFACGVFYFILRRRRPAAARVFLWGSIAGGLLIGVARVVSGAHFLSDVVWAGLFTWAALMFVVYVVLGDPWREADPAAALGGRLARWPRPARLGFLAGCGALLLVGALLVVPFRQTAGRTFPPAGGAAAADGVAAVDSAGARDGWTIRLVIGAGSARVQLLPEAPNVLSASGEYTGLGLPGARLEDTLTVDDAARRLDYEVESRGLITHLSGWTTVRIATGAAASIAIEVEDGVLILETPAGAGRLPPIDCRIPKDALRLRGVGRDQVRIERP